MKIRTKLITATITALMIIALSGILLISTLKSLEESYSRRDIARDIVRHIFELDILTYEYMQHPEERVAEQWHIKYSLMTELVSRLEIDSPDVNVLAAHIISDPVNIHYIFTRLTEISEKLNAAASRNISLLSELQDRLSHRLFMQSRMMVDSAYRLVDIRNREVLSSYRKVTYLMLALLSVLAFSTLMLVGYFNILIIKPVNMLRRGTETVAGGNLDYRIALSRRDEIGELASDFDRMTEQLQLKTVSIDTLNTEISERKKAEKTLELERKKLFDLLDGLPAFVYLQSPDHTVRYANRHFIRQFGNPEGKLCHDLLCGIKAPCEVCPTFRVFETKIPQVWEWDKTPDGRIYEVNDYPFTDTDGTPLVLELGFDITERKKMEDRIRASLEEKEVLLREIHHRVKNNLTVIYSLLDLQAKSARDPHDCQMLGEARSRIKAMSLVHEMLYRSGDMTTVQFDEYLREMINSIRNFYLIEAGKVMIDLKAEGVLLSVEEAIPLGLIVNELVSNAFKHAFPGDKKGRLIVSLTIQGERYEMMVSDDGAGLPDDIDARKSASLGLNLVDSLVRQLQGNIEMRDGGGTTYVITFGRKR